MRRIIISDLHIGSEHYRAKELADFLASVEYDELILAGDIIDFIQIPNFNIKDIDVLKSIDFSKPIYYIVGNHDASLKGFIGHKIFGVKFVEKYEFQEGGRRFRIVHGDQYDTGIVHNELCISIISVFQHFIENTFGFNLSKWWTERNIKNRKMKRVWDILSWNDDVDVLIMGHLHQPEAVIWVNEQDSIKTYINTGDWQIHTSYVSVEDGVARLRKYEPNYIKQPKHKRVVPGFKR